MKYKNEVLSFDILEKASLGKSVNFIKKNKYLKEEILTEIRCVIY